MNPIEQQIAIAESFGWHHIQNDEWGQVRGLPANEILVTNCIFTNLPNYLEDLNAMHEVEKALDDHQWEVYWYILARITPGRPTSVCHATASQRAEAYLRTIGKWKEQS